MPNMSYCQFQNTLLDLQQCYNTLVDDGIDAITPEELKALHKLRKLCEQFIDEYDEQNDLDVIDKPAAVSINEPKPYQYNVGDKVRIIGNSNSHGHAIGAVVTITMQWTQWSKHNVYEVNGEYVVREYDMELAD